jgi:hypothetical protein
VTSQNKSDHRRGTNASTSTMRSVTGPQSLAIATNSFTTLLVALILLNIVGATPGPHKVCYFPNGNVSVAEPCNLDAAQSSCCTQGWICLTNGMCQANNASAKIYTSKFFRGGCTDQNWKDPACPQICRGRKYSSQLF